MMCAEEKGFTMFEILVSIAILAVVGVFSMEFLVAAKTSSDREVVRVKCMTAAENILELSNAYGMVTTPNSLIDTYKTMFASEVVTEWCTIDSTAAFHADGFRQLRAKIEVDAAIGQVSSYTLHVEDVSTGIAVSLKGNYVTKDFRLKIQP